MLTSVRLKTQRPPKIHVQVEMEESYNGGVTENRQYLAWHSVMVKGRWNANICLQGILVWIGLDCDAGQRLSYSYVAASGPGVESTEAGAVAGVPVHRGVGVCVCRLTT